MLLKSEQEPIRINTMNKTQSNLQEQNSEQKVHKRNELQSTRTSELFMSVKSRYLNFIGQTRPQAEQDERSSDIVLHAITET